VNVPTGRTGTFWSCAKLTAVLRWITGWKVIDSPRRIFTISQRRDLGFCFDHHILLATAVTLVSVITAAHVFFKVNEIETFEITRETEGRTSEMSR
jgi:hypothetical protein